MKQYLLSQMIVAILFFVSLTTFPQNVVTVTDCNLNGWVKQPIGNSSLGFINGPATPTLGKGSLKFNVPEGGIFFPGDFVRFRNGQYSGTPLSSLTELSYSTYVEARDTIADIHFLVILVDINGDGTAEHNLVFDPRYQKTPFIRSTMPDQGNTLEKIWQTWDALHGGWFFGGTTDTDPDHNGPFFTLPEYISQYPTATIRNDAAKGGPAIRLSAGGVVFKPNFFGSMDNFKIGVQGVTTTYDFEFSTANAGKDENMVYGYGSNCITLNGSAAGGVAPYNFLWLPSGSTPDRASTDVCPTTTTTYTLTVTDANGCSHRDDVTIFVNDVRCANKMDRVKVCHNGQEICISADAVQAHLNHGDVLGSCLSSALKSAAKLKDEIITDKIKMSAYPNPFSSNARIQYVLPFDANVSISLYDGNGIEVNTLLTGFKKNGQHSLSFNTTGFKKGIYYCRLIAVGKNEVRSGTVKIIFIN